MKKQSIFEKVLRILPLVLFFAILMGMYFCAVWNAAGAEGALGSLRVLFLLCVGNMDPVSSVFWNLDAWISAKNKGCCPSEIRSRGIF